jgi:RES domain-containing protein
MVVLIFLAKTIMTAILRKLAERDDNWVELYRKMKGSSVYQAVAARFILEGFIELFLCSILNI